MIAPTASQYRRLCISHAESGTLIMGKYSIPCTLLGYPHSCPRDRSGTWSTVHRHQHAPSATGAGHELATRLDVQLRKLGHPTRRTESSALHHPHAFVWVALFVPKPNTGRDHQRRSTPSVGHAVRGRPLASTAGGGDCHSVGHSIPARNGQLGTLVCRRPITKYGNDPIPQS